MQRFILRGNVQRFRDLLERAASESEKARLRQLLDEAEEELASGTDLWRRNCPHLGISDVLGSYLENELEQIVSETHAAYGSLQVYDHRGGALYLIAQINFPVAYSRGFARVAREDGTICADTLARAEMSLSATFVTVSTRICGTFPKPPVSGPSTASGCFLPPAS